MADEKALNNAELMSDVESSSDDEDSSLQFSSDEAEPVTTAGKDVESEGESVESDHKKSFVNPLLKPKKKIDMEGQVSEGEWSSDGEAADPKDKKKGKKKDKKVLGKRSRSEFEDEAQAFFGGDAIEEVPADDPETRRQRKAGGGGHDSDNSDNVAEMRILAKRMLRKKDRSEMLDSTYNRYSFHDDIHQLPSWFVEDESKHYFRHVNPTKEEVALEKEELKAYNARPSKKVEEAKARKRKRLQKAMQKVKAKAQVIAEQDINEQAKMKQIQKMYSKEKSKHTDKKEYVFNKKFSSVQGRKAGRNVKMVDPRLKKDLIKQKKGSKGVRGYAQKKGHKRK